MQYDTVMVNLPEKSKSRRSTRLAGFMLVVLAVSIVAAGLVVYARGAGVRNAVSALDEIKAAGLGQHWAGQTQLRFYKLTREKRVGWQMRLREQRRDGGFCGITLTFFPGGGGPHQWEYWQLEEDVSVGYYESGVFGRNLAVSPAIVTLRYSAENVKTAIWPSDPAKTKTDESTTPENYLPKGLLPLVLAQIARQGEDAVFNIQYDAAGLLFSNPTAGDDGKGRFVPMSFHVEKPQDNQDENSYRISTAVQYPAINGQLATLRSEFMIDESGNELSWEYQYIFNKGTSVIIRASQSTREKTLDLGAKSDWLVEIIQKFINDRGMMTKLARSRR